MRKSAGQPVSSVEGKAERTPHFVCDISFSREVPECRVGTENLQRFHNGVTTCAAKGATLELERHLITIMKTRITVVLLSLTFVCLCYARHIAWKPNEKPSISLVNAHKKAMEALEARHVDYYCLSATVARTFSGCDWEMHFAATDGKEVWVSVGLDSVRVSEQGFQY